MNINPIVIWLLRSPLHRLLSGSTMLVTYQGRKSKRQITLPVNYVWDGEQLITLSMRKRTWWRNLRRGAPVTLRLKGKNLPAQAETFDEIERLLPGLKVLLKQMPQAARYLQVTYDEQGEPDPEDLRRAAEGRVIVRFLPGQLV